MDSLDDFDKLTANNGKRPLQIGDQVLVIDDGRDGWWQDTDLHEYLNVYPPFREDPEKKSFVMIRNTTTHQVRYLPVSKLIVPPLCLGSRMYTWVNGSTAYCFAVELTGHEYKVDGVRVETDRKQCEYVDITGQGGDPPF